MKKIYLLFVTSIIVACSNAALADGRIRISSGVRLDLGVHVGGLHVTSNRFGHHHGRVRYYPPYYRYPAVAVSYYPATIVTPVIEAPTMVSESIYYETPTRYLVPVSNEVKVQQIAPSSPPANEWWYCHNPDGFYPAIKYCPAGWQRLPK